MAELRSYHRVVLPHRIELIHGGHSRPGRLANISMNGALVELDDAVHLTPGQEVLLCIDTGQQGEAVPTLQLHAGLIHVCGTRIGMKFSGCDEEIGRRLLLLVEHMSSDPDQLQEGLERVRGYLAGFGDRL